MTLSDFTSGRDNNFNLIRIIAAYAVLISHSFALTGAAEPFGDSLGMTIGSIAVDIFFITSGFLVTASLLTRKNIIEFVWARVLRIFPALWVMLLLTVSGMGPFFTTMDRLSYFTDPMTCKYLLKCSTLFNGVLYSLPGVFEKNPYKNSVNGSLWTLPYELGMYFILAFIWGILHMMRQSEAEFFKITIITSALTAGIFLVLSQIGITKEYGMSLKLFFMFFTGASFFILREQLVLSLTIFYIFFVALLLSTLNRSTFFITYMVTITYLLFFTVYIPSGAVRKYNRLGDYSYGIYIYAFPVQQSIAALIPGVSVLSMIVISSLVTLIFSVLSWHLIEKHALKLKGQYVYYTSILIRLAGTSIRMR